MNEHSRLLKRRWMVPVAAILLIGSHVIFFDRIQHARVSLAVVSGLGVLLIAKHLGVLGSLYTHFRRRTRI